MRKSGYYWVKYLDRWEIAEYYEAGKISVWGLVGYTEIFDDKDFTEIDEKQITR